MPKKNENEIKRDAIERHPDLPNPRGAMTNIDDLAVDIRENGLTYGPLVWPVKDGKKTHYFLLDGWRRLEAIEMIRAGFEHDGDFYEAIPDFSDTIKVEPWEGNIDDAKFRVIGANIQRDPLTNMEMADAIYALQQAKDLTNRAISRKLGKSESWVSRTLTFARTATPEVKEAVKNKEITERAARQVASAPPEEQPKQLETAKEAKKKGKSAEKAIKRKAGKPSAPTKRVLMEVAKLLPEKSPTEVEEAAVNGYEAALRFAAGEMTLEDSFTYAGFDLPKGINLDEVLSAKRGRPPVKKPDQPADEKPKKRGRPAKATKKNAKPKAPPKKKAAAKKADKKKAPPKKKAATKPKADKKKTISEKTDKKKAPPKKKKAEKRQVVITNDETPNPDLEGIPF